MKKTLLILWLFIQSALHAQDTYYNSISTAGSTFITDLENRIRSPYTRITYDDYKTTILPNFESRDTTSSRKVVTCVYSGLNYVYTPPFAWIGGAGVNADSGFSREHTWCQSWMPTVNASGFTNLPEYSDQHHLFPVNQNKANGVRSNHPLGNVVTLSSTYLNAKFGTDANGKAIYEPRAEHKGDAARALLYMCVRYDGVGSYVWNFNNLNTNILPTQTNPEAPQVLATLLAWHKQDPPNKWEVDRNNYIETIQANRNPFIDHPEYVNYINFNDLTKINPVYSAEPTNQPSALSIISPTSSSVTVSWTNAVAGSQAPSGYIIEIYNSNDYFIPSDGETYSDDTNISDSKGLVNVINGATTTYTFSGLDCGTNYYVRMYSYNGTGTSINYKIDGTISSTSGSTTTSTPATVPTNYPAGFNTPILTTSSITITWSDPAGAVLPTGYLLMANTSNIFSDPVNGVTYSEDTNLADGNAIVHVAFGIQQYTFSNLNSATTYSFRLYPYTGTGCTRSYKTASFPQTLTVLYSTTSSGIGATPDVVVNEYLNTASGSEWIELLVLKDSLNMQGMKIRDYSSAGNLQNVNTPLQFASIPEWETVRKGTFIVIFSPGTGAPTEDTDFSDKKVIINSSNSTYFIAAAAQFLIANGGDAIEIYNAGNTHIHALSHGSYPGLIGSIPQPRANAIDPSSSGYVVRFFNTSSASHFSDTTKVQHSTTVTLGLPNDVTQTAFVDTALPVELTDFSYRLVNGTVELLWKTVTEVNNYGFEIERMTPTLPSPYKGEGLGGGWQKIGFVEGSGTSNTPKDYSFSDPTYGLVLKDVSHKNISTGKYLYRLKQIDRDGAFTYSNVLEINVSNNITTFAVEQNYPNPFNPTTTISYSIPTVGTHENAFPKNGTFYQTFLRVYDLLGKEIAVLVNKKLEAGNYSIQFDAKDLSSGLYFYRLQSGNFVETKRMILLK